MKPEELKLSVIRIDGGTQPRVKIDQDAVADHKAGYELGEDRPPLDVFFDGAIYWLADGFHRWHGANQAKLDEIACQVHQGTQRDAILFSVGANGTHGLRRTNDDKRKAVETLLNDKEWGERSLNWIAEKCGVSHVFVSSVSTQLVTVTSSPRPEKTKGKDGKIRLARKPTKPKPPKPLAEQSAENKLSGKPSHGTGFDPSEFDPKMNPELPPDEVDTTKTLDERIEEQRSIIERFARGLMKWFDDNLPKDPWLDDSRVDIARDQIKSAAASIRLCKAHEKHCPKCDGKGGKCKFCKGCGYLPKNSYQMAGGE